MTLVVVIIGFCVGWTIGYCVVDLCFNCYKNVLKPRQMSYDKLNDNVKDIVRK